MRRVLAFSFAAALLTAATLSRADEPSAPTPTVDHWYGWQPLLADVPSTVVMASGFLANDNRYTVPIALGGAAGLLFAAPTLHAVHGRWDKAGLSLLTRAGLAGAGTGVGYLIGNAVNPDHYHGVGGDLVGGAVGLGVGVLAAVILDDGFIAREQVQREPARATGVAFTPVLAPTRGGASVGFGGIF